MINHKSKALAAMLAAFICLLGCNNSNSQQTPSPSPGVSAGTPSPSPASGDIGTDEAIQIAKDWLQLCADGKYEDAYAACDATMKTVWDGQGGVEAVWTQLDTAMGGFDSIDTEGAEPAGSSMPITTIIKVAYQNGALTASITVNAQGEVSGVLFQQAQQEADKSPLPEGLEERAVVVDAGTGFPLDGMFTLPKDAEGKLPCVILVQGSGASGMDAEVGPNRLFEQIARGLADRGMAVIRYDKRTYAYAENVPEKLDVVYEYVEDVKAAVELAKQQPECNPEQVYIIGHSQGASLAPRFYDEGADVAGMVLLAGSPRSMVDALIDQQTMSADELEASGQADTARQQRDFTENGKLEYEKLKDTPLDDLSAEDTIFTVSAYYLLEMERYTPAVELIIKNDIPVLILQGENDVQVYADRDFTKYKQGLEGFDNATFKSYPGLNHLFMPSQASGLTAGVNEYNNPGVFSANVLDDIATWINSATH